jgi:hypothetical protein
MKRFSVSRFLLPVIGICLFSVLTAIAQNLPADAPVLVSQPDSTRALTAARTRRGFDFAPRVFQADVNPEITFFVTNLELLPAEGASAFRVDAQDARGWRYPLQIVSFEQTEDRCRSFRSSRRKTARGFML